MMINGDLPAYRSLPTPWHSPTKWHDLDATSRCSLSWAVITLSSVGLQALIPRCLATIWWLSDLKAFVANGLTRYTRSSPHGALSLRIPEGSCDEGVSGFHLYHTHGSLASFWCQSWHSCGDVLSLWLCDHFCTLVAVVHEACAFQFFAHSSQNLLWVAYTIVAFALCFTQIQTDFQFFWNFSFIVVKFLLAFSILYFNKNKNNNNNNQKTQK